jgi:PPOX class probable F420-dependent enzyme
MAIDHKPKTTPNLKRLRNIRANAQVSLLTDEYDEDWTHLWWVRVDGKAQVIEQEPTRSLLAAHLIKKYEQYQKTPPEGPVIQVEIEKVQSWTYR